MHDAFISYSRRNADFARRLEKALKEFKPPRDLKVPQRYLDVFRDETDFTGVEYYQSVERHLGESTKLIVICSPAARASVYVGDEIRRFAQKHGADSIIPILLDGVPNNEASPDKTSECAFPDVLCELLGMPLAIPYRGFDEKKDRINKGAFADSWFALLANLYGISRADVEQREIRRQRRNRRITAGIVGGIMASLAIALVVSLLFYRRAVEQRGIAEKAAAQERVAKDKERLARLAEAAQRKVADERRQEAERERAAAVREAIAARSETAGRLAVQALEKVDGAPEDALALGLSAVDTFHRHGDPIAPRAMGALQRIAMAFAGSRPALPWRKDRTPVVADDPLEWAAASDPSGTIIFGAAGTSDPRTLSPPSAALRRGERWAPEAAHLAFAGRSLIAMRGVVKDGSKEIKKGVIWFWRLGQHGIEGRPVVAGSFDVESSAIGSWFGVELMPSPDGRWLLWEVGLGETFLQRIDPPGKSMPLGCGLWDCKPRQFTADSRMLFVHKAGEIHRFLLGGDRATEQPVMETEVRDAVNLAVLTAPTGDAMRVAIFGEDGSAEWWEIAGADPVRHALPNFFEPFKPGLEVFGLENALVRTSLAWDDDGEAIMATVAEKKSNEFGIAAVHDLQGEAWQPVEHRHELKATETTADLQGTGSGVTGGYRVNDAGNLGVASALWWGGDIVSMGFDGTVLYRRFDQRRVAEKFQLVATGASSIALAGRGIAIGKRDGKVMFVESSSAPLNGHGSPIREVRSVTEWSSDRLSRLLSTDAAGVSRIWDMTAPGMQENEREVRVTADWKWVVTDDDAGAKLWPLQLPEPLWAPRRHRAFTGAKAVAWNEDASQVATLHVEPGNRLPVVVRLWDMRGERLPLAPVTERRFAARAEETGWTMWLATTNEEARLLIDDHEQLRMTDLRQPLQALRKVGDPDIKLATDGASPDLHWLVVKNDKQAFLVDTRRWGKAPRLISLAGGVDLEHVNEWSADRRWLTLEGKFAAGGTPHFFIDLTAVSTGLRPSPVPRVRDVCLGRGRAPLMRTDDDDRSLYMWQPPGRFVKVAPQPRFSALAWDQSGRWLAIGHQGGRVWLTQPSAGTPAELGRELRSAMKQPSLPLPAEVEARGEIERLFPFPEQGWIVARVDKHVLVWHRGGSGAWEQPLVFTDEELRVESLDRVKLRPDGRMALIGNQVMSFDPDYLPAYSRRMSNGRSN